MGFHGSEALCHMCKGRKSKGDGIQEGSWAQEPLKEVESMWQKGSLCVVMTLLAGELSD